jgi:hypothetical protein
VIAGSLQSSPSHRSVVVVIDSGEVVQWSRSEVGGVVQRRGGDVDGNDADGGSVANRFSEHCAVFDKGPGCGSEVSVR